MRSQRGEASPAPPHRQSKLLFNRRKKRPARFPVYLLNKLGNFTCIHAPRLAMLHAHRHFALGLALCAHVARFGENRQPAPFPTALASRFALVFERTGLGQFNAELALGQTQMLFAGHLAGMAPRAVLVVDKDSLCHDFPLS